ncbi:MAG: COX15/CtaA family protein, partial [Gammaproteobacteria bacterium]|nr:COX15/CtaA family protein [Gammaproteobacteria bacterium]
MELLVSACLVLAFTVIVFGAYVRLTDAGLGCPDWPGCYGLLTVPEEAGELAAAAADYERPVEGGKAWREMIHRYLASTLGLAILLLAGVTWRHRREARAPLAVVLALVPLVMFQGALGMWTVTLLLKPLVVTAHLLGGLTILALLWLALLKLRAAPAGSPGASALAPWALAALAVVCVQIALGGWTSTNYAALACTDFPTCHGRWWPDMDFREAFVLWRGLGVDYEYGVLD